MAIENLERILSAHPFFAGLGADVLATVTGCAANERFESGQFLIRDGEAADRFFVLRAGTVGVEVFVPGRGPVTIETLGEGEVLGFSWLLPPYRSRFDARALTFVRALSLDGTCLRTKCEKDPALGYEILKRVTGLIVQRLEATRVQLLDIYGVHA